ncbi:MAG: hypothetical protein SFY66_18495 [Oculatellaceae cyanobacterium bins.114]|nr:hypothetical protein [Oculatellaceae cyanobacterium bins.114]
MIKNLEPLEKIKASNLHGFNARATLDQRKVANQFKRDYWLVEAVRHINKRDWFLTFERTVHQMDGDLSEIPARGRSKVCHIQRFRVCLNSKGKILNYQRLPVEIIIPDYD